MRKECHDRNKHLVHKVLPAIYAPSRNEEGSFVLFTTMMILLLMTLTGIAATKTANTEVSIAGNEAAHSVSTYNAEGGAVEAAMLIEAMNDENLRVVDNGSYPVWMTFHTDPAIDEPGEKMSIAANWVSEGGADDNADVATFNADVQYAAVDKGGAKGSSLIMTGGEQMREYQVYGLSDTGSGQAMIEMGYRKRLQ